VLFFASRIAFILFLYLHMYFYRLAVNKSSCSYTNSNTTGPISKLTHYVNT